MTDNLCRLIAADLQELIKALSSGRLIAPFSRVGLERIVSSPLASQVADELQQLAGQGFAPAQMATTLQMMDHARSQRNVTEDEVDLVVTGPEPPGASNRDTAVVVRELFAHANLTVLVAGNAVYQGKRVFQALVDRMEQLPNLNVRMFLDVQRGPGDSSAATDIVRRFADRFRTTQWPKSACLPEVFYYSSALAMDQQKRACLHAKCVVVDRKILFVSSANFTEAAQERNLEVGLLIRNPVLAEQVQTHFDNLLNAGMLERLL